MSKILVIEDEKNLLFAATKKLELNGFEVIGVGTAEEGLEKMKEKPDLIWLDLLLPKMGGLEFLHKIRQTPEYKKIPVIIVANSGGQDKIDKAFELNVVDYLVKAEHTLEYIISKINGVLK